MRTPSLTSANAHRDNPSPSMTHLVFVVLWSSEINHAGKTGRQKRSDQ